jgi:putative ABC transport system permease protein
LTIWRLVIREIRHRRLSFALSAASVLAATACLVATVTLLDAHDAKTREILRIRGAEVEAKVAQRRQIAAERSAELNEAFRKIMLRFGYNLLILPKDAEVVDIAVQGAPSTYMDEALVGRLADSGIMTIRHLLPILKHRQILVAGERRQEVFLVGTRGEIPLNHRAPKKPMLIAVPKGKIILGQAVHEALGADVGDKVRVVDRELEIAKIYPARNPLDDASAWIDLEEAQSLLGKQGLINGILALNCLCSHAELDKVRQDVLRILPETQVRISVADATIRFDSRTRAAEEAEAQVQLAQKRGQQDLEREAEHRASMKAQIESFAAWALPPVLAGSVLWVGLLALGNIRERRAEIALLRALGLSGGQLFAVFLSRAALTGLVGACLGCVAGLLLAGAWSPATAPVTPVVAVLVLVLAPCLSALAALAPAIVAARQDPAVVLAKE